jgi:hypothetical protein
MNKIKLFSLAIIVSTILSSCAKEDSATVNQDKIYAEYELFYNKNEDKTYASAVFKFSNIGGTQLQLSSPSEVKFNSDIIPYDGTFAYYRKEYAGFISSGTFTFKDKDGLVYTNIVSVAKPITNIAIDTIKRSNGAYTYTWVGDTVKTNEAVGLVIGNNVNPLTFQFFRQASVNTTNLVLPLTQLNQLPIGMSYSQLDRVVQSNAPSVTSAGGLIRGKYRSLDKNLYVK